MGKYVNLRCYATCSHSTEMEVRRLCPDSNRSIDPGCPSMRLPDNAMQSPDCNETVADRPGNGKSLSFEFRFAALVACSGISIARKEIVCYFPFAEIQLKRKQFLAFLDSAAQDHSRSMEIRPQRKEKSGNCCNSARCRCIPSQRQKKKKCSLFACNASRSFIFHRASLHFFFIFPAVDGHWARLSSLRSCNGETQKENRFSNRPPRRL